MNESNPFSALEDKNPARSNDPLETMTGASPHPVEEGVSPSLPNPGEVLVKGEGTRGDVNIQDSIAKALLEDLQEKWTGNNLRQPGNKKVVSSLLFLQGI